MQMHVLLDVAAKTFGGEMLMRVAVACTIVFANKKRHTLPQQRSRAGSMAIIQINQQQLNWLSVSKGATW
jgi:hypothetical protein